jgi:nucleotide-binding universal stress UspA family protein
MYKKILVPLDGSELSESVLNHVVTIATNCQVPEVVLARVREPLDKSVKKTLDAKIFSQLDEAYYDEAANYLEEIATTLKRKGIAVKVEVLSGKPAEEILKYSQRSGVDLIIMSTHGRSGVSRWVFGSVADKVIRQTEIPVLIKPAGHRAI